MYSKDTTSLSRIRLANTFSLCVSFHPLHMGFHRAKVFNFNEVQLINFFLAIVLFSLPFTFASFSNCLLRFSIFHLFPENL